MALKKYKSVTPGQRHMTKHDNSALWKGRPFKKLTKGISKTGGRNNFGRITAWHRGGGAKRLFRTIDFKRNYTGTGTVHRIEYDPNRTANIALVEHDGNFSYIIAPKNLKANDVVQSGDDVDFVVGNTTSLANIPEGTIIHNVEIVPGKGGQLARSAGCSVQLSSKNSGYAFLKLPSGTFRKVKLECKATIGVVSNTDHKNISYGKAGVRRNLGRRPHVRGVVMNPVDHPHGGGEGKTSGGRHPVTPWGKPTKGKKTRKIKRTNKYHIKN